MVGGDSKNEANREPLSGLVERVVLSPFYKSVAAIHVDEALHGELDARPKFFKQLAVAGHLMLAISAKDTTGLTVDGQPCPFTAACFNIAVLLEGNDRRAVRQDDPGLAVHREERGRDVGRARNAAKSAPITVPTPRMPMRNPARPAPPWNVSDAMSVRKVGKL